MSRRMTAVFVVGTLMLLAACGGPGQPDVVPPTVEPPTGLSAVAGDGWVDLTWTASTTEGVAEYRVFRGEKADDLTQIQKLPASARTYRVTGLTNGTEYFFAVQAATAEGATSKPSGAARATPVVGAAGGGGVPVVTSTSPASGATGVGINANLNVSFSAAMNEAATEAAFSASPAVACAFSWNAASDRLTCTPSGELGAGTSYTVTIGTGATSAGGTALAAPHVFTFKTGATAAPACVLGAGMLGECVLGN